ncbi:MAG: methionine--tRNA ligase subunit beta [Candidatus Brocadiales bacterium]|nr:methionine--tRNA ligase subunit beta [Candidatus Brocadiales bacterium]
MITIEDFRRIELRVAEVKSVEDHPQAQKLLILKIDAGDGVEGRQLVAGIKGHYRPEELVGKKIIIVNNLAPVLLRGWKARACSLLPRMVTRWSSSPQRRTSSQGLLYDRDATKGLF